MRQPHDDSRLKRVPRCVKLDDWARVLLPPLYAGKLVVIPPADLSQGHLGAKARSRSAVQGSALLYFREDRTGWYEELYSEICMQNAATRVRKDSAFTLPCFGVKGREGALIVVADAAARSRSGTHVRTFRTAFLVQAQVV